MVKMVNGVRLIPLMFLCIAWYDNAFPRYHDNRPKWGIVYGTIMAQNQGIIEDATIVFERRGRRIEIKTLRDGSYHLGLPSGIYQVIVERYGFCPATRALFKIEEDTSVKLDFTLYVCTIGRVFNLDENKRIIGESDEIRCPFKEERVFPEPISPKQPGELFILYGKKSAGGNVDEFTGFTVDDRLRRVMISYNLLTIYADRVRYYKKDKYFEATGNVLIEDQDRNIEASKIIVRVLGYQAKYQIIQQ
jgi:Carboxypeptidase regulatory-like domain